jgi:hypothetical protein
VAQLPAAAHLLARRARVRQPFVTRTPRRPTRMAQAEAGRRNGFPRGVQGESSTWAQRLQQAASTCKGERDVNRALGVRLDDEV